MKIPRPLFWQQGMLLQPQHFQLQDQAAESRLLPFLQHLTPHFWGVAEMDLDEGAIGTGTFNLDSGSFFFQDGTYLQYPGNALFTQRHFGSRMQEGQPLQVSLGLKKWDQNGENVTVIDGIDQLGSVTTRFVAFNDTEEVRDLHGKGPDAQVTRLHYLLRVFWEGETEDRGEYQIIPLAQLEEFGGIKISQTFLPPSISLNATKPLIRLVREVRDLLAARIYQLEQYKNQRGVHNSQFGSRDMVYLLALRTLNRHVPLLFHLTEAPVVHPWHAYGALRQLVGELSSFSLHVNFVGEADAGEQMLPPYDHNNLWECFSAAQQLVIQLLDEITAGPDYIVRLVNDGTYFVAELKPAMLAGGNRYFLALKTEDAPQLVQQSLGAVAKLSTREHLPLLTSHALPGLALEYLPSPPQELPRRSNTLYFAVDHHNEQWDLVTKGHNIALNWSTAPTDLEVDLMVVEKA